ncbi:hypothetical protein GGR54DRAFT_360579 [Hypoxylon sp. NC1633]|nr:hypothetical protein GGR54DRAFT_360579 [Hypoxylon sp. NC1633]
MVHYNPFWDHRVGMTGYMWSNVPRLCEDDTVHGYRGFIISRELWKDRQNFETSLETEIGKMMTDIKTIAEVWMQAEQTSQNKSKPAPAPTTAVSSTEPIIAAIGLKHGSWYKQQGKKGEYRRGWRGRAGELRRAGPTSGAAQTGTAPGHGTVGQDQTRPEEVGV